MDIVFENLPLFIVSTVVFLIVYAALLNVYFIYKNGFHVRVNCWFCNENSKVIYAQRNSFICPFCSQYNGFTKDGDYNRVIESQRNASLNTPDLIPTQKTENPTPTFTSNGLCESCNRNQELKVIQLANYEPLVEKNYYQEIKHFEKQLEKTYQLCKPCSRILKKTIRHQNANIFGNRLKTLKTLKNSILAKSSNSAWGSSVITFYQKISIVQLILLVLSLLIVSSLCGLHLLLPQRILLQNILPTTINLSTIYPTTYNLGFVKNLPKTLKLQETVIFQISILGLFIELLKTLFEKEFKLFSKCNRLFAWLIIGLTSSIHFKLDVAMYFKLLEVFCSLFLTYIYTCTCIKPKPKNVKKIQLRRLKRQLESEDYSDVEDSDSGSLNKYNVSYKTAFNTGSPNTANQSFKSTLNDTFCSVRSRISTSSRLTNKKKVELNKHFNELNLGANNSNMLREYNSTSPNPFLNQSNRPQSPASTYNYVSSFSLPLNQFQQRAVFSPRLNMSVNNTASFSGSVSPKRIYSPNKYFNNFSTDNFYNNEPSLNKEPSTAFLSKNSYQHSTSFSPKDTSSVISHPVTIPKSVLISNPHSDINSPCSPSVEISNSLRHNNRSDDTSSVMSHPVNIQKSPNYNLRSNLNSNMNSPLSPWVAISNSSRHNDRSNGISPFSTSHTSLNNSFRPLSPVESSSKNPSSSSKMVNTFYSKGSGSSFSMSYRNNPVQNSSSWLNLNGRHMPQRFTVNTLSNIQYNSPVNGTFVQEDVYNDKCNNSRSSSSNSSGFISTGGFAKGRSRSLPNSRENSPERTSLLSEPVYNHY